MRTVSRIVRGAACVATLFLTISGLRALSPADEPLVKVVEKCRPAVVNINTDRIVQRQVQDPFDRFFGNYDNRSYIVKQRVGSLGSGVVIEPSGYILTCAHVVGRAEDKSAIRVTLSDGTVLPAKLLASDEDADMALLKVDASGALPYIGVAPADLSPNLLGETVVALGNPVGLQSSVSAGILSARDRKAKTEGGEAEGLLQTDAAINPGNSGGALVDIEGKFVGLCNAKLGGLIQGTTSVEGIGFAIPGAKVSPWVADAIAVAKGEKAAPVPVSLVDVVWKKFGVRFQNITPDLAAAFQLPSSNGMLVAAVAKGSPAEQGGMANGMVLVRLGNVQIANSDSLPRELAKVKPGDAVTFTLGVVEQRGSLLVRNMRTIELQSR